MIKEDENVTWKKKLTCEERYQRKKISKNTKNLHILQPLNSSSLSFSFFFFLGSFTFFFFLCSSAFLSSIFCQNGRICFLQKLKLPTPFVKHTVSFYGLPITWRPASFSLRVSSLLSWKWNCLSDFRLLTSKSRVW